MLLGQRRRGRRPLSHCCHRLPHSEDGEEPCPRQSRVRFRWALEDGQKSPTDLEYVPLPPDLMAQIEAYWKSAFAGMD